MKGTLVQWIGIAVLLAASGAARGEPPAASAVGAQPAAELPASWAALSESRLQQLQGGAASEPALGALLEQGVVGNQIGAGVSTGSVALGAAAISGVQGIVVTTFNTGNSAAIQTNLRVDVRLE